jgi:hypothetical protein
MVYPLLRRPSSDASFGQVPPSCDNHTSEFNILLLLIIEVSQRLLVQPGAWTDVDAKLFYFFALAQLATLISSIAVLREGAGKFPFPFPLLSLPLTFLLPVCITLHHRVSMPLL